MTDKPRNPWPMLAYHELPFDLEETAWDVATMCSCCPMPYKWDRNQLEDSNGNSVIVADCIPAINAAPAMLLRIRADAEELERLRCIEGKGEYQNFNELYDKLQRQAEQLFEKDTNYERIERELTAARAVVNAARDYQTGVYDVSLHRLWDALSAYDAAIEDKK